MKLIFGLGNPGAQYVDTRHNLGFKVVDELAKRCGVSLAGEKFHARLAATELQGERVVLLRPTTFMNRSGDSVVAAGRFYKIGLEDFIVIADDLALPVGRLRMRMKGSAGSHNGLQDVVDRLGTDQWSRLRIGIGAAVGDPAQYVLSRFCRDEMPVVNRAVLYAADAIESWVHRGAEATMSRFNGDPPED
ncbi:MAG: aminoacyl-tRNA hydrolase [Planctomycetota bacterium]